MKIINYLVIFVLVFAIFLGGFLWLGGYDFTSIVSLNKSPEFHFGVTLNPTPTGDKTREGIKQIVDSAKDLGVTTVRMNYPVAYPEKAFAVDWAVDELRSKPNRKEAVLIIEHQDNILQSGQAYEKGFALGSELASKYKGKVKYYQMGNESGAYALKPNWGGETFDAYDPAKYRQVLDWAKGISQGINQADPDAKRIVTGHHVQYALWQQAKKDGLEFEIVGWDWFHQDFPIPSLKNFEKDDKPFDLLSKLSELGEVWITEAGINGAVVGYPKAGDYLSSFAKEVYSIPQMKGFFAFSLTDEFHQSGEKNWQKGLIAIKKSGKKWVLSEPRETFNQYKAVIEQVKTGKLKRAQTD